MIYFSIFFLISVLIFQNQEGFLSKGLDDKSVER